jgi:hypothetical protein
MSEVLSRPPVPPQLEKEFGGGIRRAFEIQDGWSRGTLPETPELKVELEALWEQELDYRDRYEISRETIQRLMAERPAGLRLIQGGKI